MAEELSLETTIIEEREQLMVDPTTLRTSHFLKPSLNPNSLPPPLPKIQSFSLSSRPKVIFSCRSNPLKEWLTWFENLKATHEQTWRKAGIFDAIKCSTYHIEKHSNLIFCLPEKWCPETNTFVFSWGEVTVTLEDVFMLGGFSPLGVSILSKCSSLGKNVKQVENKLIKSFRELTEIDSNVTHLRWMEYFMGCGNEIEHAGFLALWLARHVFPSKNGSCVQQSVFSIAATLSCGVKYALGKAVLASVYKDLTLLKRKIMDLVSEKFYDGRPLRLSLPMHLVQVWVWERFPSIGPVPRMINCGETRLARWETLIKKAKNNIDHIKMFLDSARESFRWRPYAMCLQNWLLPRFYVDSGKWVVVGCDEQWRVFASVLIGCKLVGIDCSERYNPHRVALQFGFDQDIPESIDNCKLALRGYKKNLNGLKLYVPPRLYEGDVTYRYSVWWRERFNPLEEILVRCKRKKRTKTRLNKLAKFCDTREDFTATGIGSSVTEKSPSLRLDNDTKMTCVFHMQVGLYLSEDTSMEGIEEYEMKSSNVTLSRESNKFSDSSNSNNEVVNGAESLIDHVINSRTKGTTSQIISLTRAETLIEHEIDILGCKLAEIELNKETGVVNSPCKSLQCSKAMNLTNEVGQVMEENLIEHAKELNKQQTLIVLKVMKGSSEYLDVDQCRSKSLIQHKGNSIKVACEVNTLDPILEDVPDEALCQDRCVNPADIPVVNDVDVDNDVNNPFWACFLEYESRISRLEQGFTILLAANVPL